MNNLKRFFFFILNTMISVSLTMNIASADASNYQPDLSNGADNFYRSDKVQLQKVSFPNLYKMKVVGNLFTPKTMKPGETLPAIIVGHPMGAVKEQSANLYAQKLAEQGFITLSLDFSFWGESEGEPRNAVAPDIYSEDFSAAVDFLGTQDFVQKDNIGILGICASGAFVINAAKIDPRMKAIATVSMVDMGAATRFTQSIEQKHQILSEAAEQRYVEFKGGETKYTGGTPNELTDETDAMGREFYDFYRTERGKFTPEGSSPELTTHPTLSSNVKFMNFYPFEDIQVISPRPLLFIVGENAMSKIFSDDAYNRSDEPKELYVVKGAGHVDLYDRVNLIPFNKLTQFFSDYLK
ncbi:alpha/beta hydrolase [Vibrio parahaemolyticus]|uniref:alpha/beta hydrolase n=1 Tax=Vibrio parahaemolyticus TaxID=670 RepID=UPI00112421FE|nr:alpha/beta hydrolase [Vibrio parahaemolyticus]TOP86017.1 hypothetical protein CGH07_23865 [Vibrio parahaemolyticus]